MKFKVGDIVRVRSDIDRLKISGMVMEKYIGKTARVRQCNGNGWYVLEFIGEEGLETLWHVWWFEKVYTSVEYIKNWGNDMESFKQRLERIRVFLDEFLLPVDDLQGDLDDLSKYKEDDRKLVEPMLEEIIEDACKFNDMVEEYQVNIEKLILK